MCDFITFDILREIVCDLADTMDANADFLTQLDVAIGDGDHGRNMAAGFGRVREDLLVMPPTTPGLLLRTTGMILVTTVGGASGPLYGAAFIAAGITAGSNMTLGLPDLAVMTGVAADALARRGRCRVGDKTILDALSPAADALDEAAAAGRTLVAGLAAAAEGARAGMEAATPLIARRGLAMQYGAASAGHQDPGATSCYLIFDSAVRTVKRLYRGT
jgi:dihydroxyacetone kinase-like protein